MRDYTPLISGEELSWTGSWIESADPATGKIWSRIARCGVTEADKAIQSADRAFRTGAWAEANANARADMLDRLADVLEARWEELVEPAIRDNGKRIAEVRGQFACLHTLYRYFAAEARKLVPEPQANSVLGVESTGYHLPYGVVIAITPWNSLRSARSSKGGLRW